jgi:hypothetical protein
MENAKLGKARAARLLALLWAATALLFLLHPQAALPLFALPGFGEKGMGAGLSVVACLALAFFPLSRALLAACFLLSAFSCLAWHSWLGAYQPLVPVGFLFLLVFRRAGLPEARAALFQSLCLGLLVSSLHRLNPTFLAGQEFLPGGTIFRDLPAFLAQPGFAVDLAITWLLSGLAPVPAFVLRRSFGWILFAAGCLLSVLFYKVLFYGFFLLVPALLFADPYYLRAWRGERSFPLRPLHVYIASLVLFLLWYLLARQSLWPYLLAVSLGLVAAAGTRFDPGAQTPSARGRASAFWGSAWLLYLALPFFLPLPAPFALTPFSSREARFPPGVAEENWKGMESCERLKNDYALRWGYKLWQDGGSCKLLVYRKLP